MPNRIIRESALTSATLYRLSAEAERLFWRLVLVADDFGRFEAEPQLLKAKCFPLWPDKRMSQAHALGLYQELEAVQAVQTYAVGGRAYGHFVNWDRYQRRRASTSKYPPPTSDNICQRVTPNVPVVEESRSEESRSEESGNTALAPDGAARSARPWLLGDTIRTALGKTRFVTLENNQRWWQAQFRARNGVNFAQELLNAEAWCVTNPERAPKRNFRRFLNSWFARAASDE